MTFAPTIITTDLDPEVLIDGVRAALIANATVLSLVNAPSDDPALSRIVSEMGKLGTITPFIVLNNASTVFQSSYNEPRINMLIDVSIYVDGWSTVTVRQLLKASLRALLVDRWTAVGMRIESSSIEGGDGTGIRNITEILPATIRRGRQFTIRVIAAKIS